MKRITALLTALVLLLASVPASAQDIDYPDVPATHWARPSIELAREYGLMEGYPSGRFGLSDSISREQFVTLLCRMFGWDVISPDFPSFSDCAPKTTWAFPYIETALLHGVIDPADTFRPSDPITREEMAVMLVRALDYTQLAEAGYNFDLPFADVTENQGYIAVAWHIGLVQGYTKNGQLMFGPNGTATREQAAVMLVRIYERYISKIDWLHGFYAISSYNQVNMASSMDGVSLGWARLDLDEDDRPFVNSTTKNGNSWTIPKDPNAALDYFKENNIPYHLNIFSTDKTVLADETSRQLAVDAIVTAAENYCGVTMDFESLRAADKDNFTAFMTSLRSALPESTPFYVCVPPAVPDGAYYDGYDFRALGELCDKVILMAHDYQYTSVPSSYIGTARTNSPLTPFNKIYYALAAITDPETGVADRSKLALAISFGSVGWKVDAANKLVSTSSVHPSPSTIITRLRQEDTVFGWSDLYRNPYVYYTTESGNRYRLWYENERSVMDKIELAQMFGITGVSLWRLGLVPGYNDEGLEYNVWSALLSDR